MQPEQNLFIPIDELLRCKETTFICPLGTTYDNTLADHANSLVFVFNNEGKNLIYRFEPHGVDEVTDNIIINELRTYPELNNFEYIGTTKTCPYLREGVQLIEGLLNNRNKRPQDLGGAGFCFIWSLIYLEYVINYIDIYSPDEIHNLLIHNTDNLTEFMYKFTYRLLERYHQMILDDYPFRNTEEFAPILRFKKFNLETIQKGFFGYEYRAANFDVENDENLEKLYKLLYDGYLNFNDIIKLFFKDFLVIEEKILNNIQKMLEALENGSLYDKLREWNEIYTLKSSDHKFILDDYLPRTINYYKPIVKKSFIEYIDKWRMLDENTVIALIKLYERYFHEPLS